MPELNHETILQEVFRHTPVGVALLDLHGTIFDANPALARIVGVEESRLAGAPFESFVDDADRKVVRELLTWLREGRIETTAQAIRLVRDRGNRVAVSLNMSTVESTDVEPAWCIAFVEDIEQRVVIESRLRDSEVRYRRIVEDMTDLICRSSPDGTILFVNDAYCRHYGANREDVIGHSIFEFVPESERQLVRDKLASLAPGHPTAIGEQKGLHQDGRTTWESWTYRGFFDDDGRLVERQAVGRDITDDRAANERLRMSEERYRRIVEDQMDLISRSRPDGTLLFVNDAYCRHYKVRREDVIGRSFFNFIGEADRESVRQKIASLTPDAPVAEGKHQVIEHDGRVGWQRWIDRGFFDQDGTLIEIQSVGHDVTEEREATERLRRSEERFRGLFRSLPVAVWESDWTEVIDGLRERGIDSPEKIPNRASETVEVFKHVGSKARITAANTVALELGDVDTLEEFERWVSQAATPDSMRRFIVAASPLLFEGARSITVPVTFASTQGKETEGILRIARLSPDDWRMILVMQDMSEFTRIGRELRDRQELMSRIEAAAHVGSWEWNPATNLLRGSNEFWKILTGTQSGPTERPLRECIELIHPDDLAEVRDLVNSAIAPTVARPDSQRKEFRLVHPGASTIIARANIFYSYGERGVVERAFGTLQNVTDIKRAEREAEQHREEMIRADKMISLGILVSGVAHEINNPNHSIMLNLPILRDAWRDVTPRLDDLASSDADLRVAGGSWSVMRDEIPDVLNDIEQASERIRTIVAELKGFAVDREKGVRKPSSLNDVARSALRLLSNIIRKSTNELRVELTDDLPRTCMSAQRIEQVIVNLVVNACQALDGKDRAITIRTHSSDGFAHVSVIDEGQGIPAEDLRKVTDPFFTTKRNTGGTGLGLAVSQRIVEDHEGRLTFRSEPGHGTTVVLSLPIDCEEATNG